MRVDMHNGEIGEKFVCGGDGWSGKGMLTTEDAGELPALQYFSGGLSRNFECGGMIQTAIIEGLTGVDTHFDGTPVELLIVEVHLSGSIEYRLWPAFCAFHLPHTLLHLPCNSYNLALTQVT